MRFFNRRGRSKSVDRSAKSKRDREEQQYHQPHIVKQKSKACDDSIGSELPTLDQFEISVPSKSFASAVSVGDQLNELPFDSREEDEFDNRSTSDISSITSVSYRAGYYYLRNVKKKMPEKKKHSGCLPSCSCTACMPCGCSWLTCCCCSEARSELAVTDTTSKPSMIAHSQLREKMRKAHRSPGRRSVAPPGHPAHGALGYPHYPGSSGSRRMNSNDRGYTMPSERRSKTEQPTSKHEDDNRMYPSIKRNHSLFDELSEAEEEKNGNGGQRGRYNKKKNRQNPWLKGRAAGIGTYGAPPEYIMKEKSSRNRPIGRGRRAERYYGTAGN